jgi:SnoaL-like polyketide cyclase
MGSDGVDLVRRFLKEVFDNKNVDAIDELVDPKGVDRTPWPGYGSDRDEAKRALSDFIKAFPDLKLTIDDVISEKDKVVVRSTFSGTNTGEFMGMPPTGKRVEGIGGIDIVEIKGSKLGDHWGYVDNFAMMVQLGLMQPPA